MNIVVLMKQVPDTEGARTLDPADNTVDRGAVDPVINYIDEFAIEEGLRLREAHGGEVTILTVGPERATESIRKALSMGVGQGGARVGSGACTARMRFRRRRCSRPRWARSSGTWSWRARRRPIRRMSVVPAMLAEVLGVPQLSQARKVTVDGDAYRSSG